MEFIISIVLIGLLLFYSLIIFRKASHYSKKALLIINPRFSSKVWLPILMIVIISATINIGMEKHVQFLYLFLIILVGFIYIIFIIIIPISSIVPSVVITEDGIRPIGPYPFLGLIRWERIKKISERFAHVLIETDKKYFPISLPKFVWQFGPEDIKQIQALLAKKKKLLGKSKRKN